MRGKLCFTVVQDVEPLDKENNHFLALLTALGATCCPASYRMMILKPQGVILITHAPFVRVALAEPGSPKVLR